MKPRAREKSHQLSFENDRVRLETRGVDGSCAKNGTHLLRHHKGDGASYDESNGDWRFSLHGLKSLERLEEHDEKPRVDAARAAAAEPRPVAHAHAGVEHRGDGKGGAEVDLVNPELFGVGSSPFRPPPPKGMASSPATATGGVHSALAADAQQREALKAMRASMARMSELLATFQQSAMKKLERAEAKVVALERKMEQVEAQLATVRRQAQQNGGQ